MKNTKKLLALLTACTLVAATSLVNMSVVKAETTTATTAVANVSPKACPRTASQEYAEAMQPGWNLGNSYDAVNWWNYGEKPNAINTNPGTVTDETVWGNPVITKALIDKVAAEGFKSIRIPFTTSTRTGAAPDYTLDPTFLARYAQTVQWAIDDGLYVMVNMHHDSSWVNFYEADDDDGSTKEKYKAIWTQLANYFKDYDDKVCFESINEPTMDKNHNGDKVASDVGIKRLADVNAEFIKIVRGTGGKNATRMLVLPTLACAHTAEYCDSVTNTIQGDPNIMATYHYYGPWVFSENINGWSTFDDNVVKDINAAFDDGYNNFVSKGIGVLIGEYGLLGQGGNNQNKGEIMKYMDYVNYYAKVNGLTMMMWDAGLFMDEGHLTWKDENIDILNMMKSSWTTRNSYAKSDTIFIEDMKKDKDIPITLNGNTLTSIYSGAYKLVEGQDYTYANSTVTLKSTYLSKIIENDIGGFRAVLTFKFSAGLDWKSEVWFSKAPVLGSTPMLTIPIQYNGSKITELETVDANGKSVSPMGWTTYIDGGSYKIDYQANSLTLTDGFFKDLKVNQFTLKLHLQDGKEMDILINRDGDHITYSAK